MSSSAIPHDILDRLGRVRKLQLKTDVQSSALVFGAVILLLSTLVALAELVGQFGSALRTLLAALFLWFGFSLFLWFVARPLLRLFGIISVPDNFSIAKKVGDRFPKVHDRLLNLLQLHREISSGTSLYSPDLVDASFHDLTETVRGIDFTTTVDRSVVSRSARWFAATMAGVLLLSVGLWSPLVGAVDRLAHFSRDYRLPARYTFEVDPGNKEIVKGTSVDVRVKVHSASSEQALVDRLRLFSRLEGQSRPEEGALQHDSSGMYRTSLKNIRGNTEYYVQAEEVKSDEFKLTVVDRPVIKSLQVRLDYPAYTKLPPRIQDEFIGDVSALAGTKISLRGVVSKQVKQGRILFGEVSSLPLSVHGEQWSTTFPLKTETMYSVEVQDAEGLTNQDPLKYQLKVIPDEPPTVAITQPGRNLDLAGVEALPLLINIKDDFGFSKLRLGYRLVHSRYEQPAQNSTFLMIPLPAEQGAEIEIPYLWNLTQLSLVPEDVVEYFAEVFDNDAVNGPKSARSQVYQLRLPSLEEVFTDLDKGHQESIDDLKKAMEEAKKLKENLESINQDLKKNKDPDWQQQKKLEEMAKKYQETQKKLNDVKSRVDDMVQKMQEQKTLSKETLEKYLELQQLMEQINADELQQFLKQMQQAMQNVDKEKLQQMLQQMTFSEERFRQSLERTMNLLKRIQIEQKMDEAKKRAQDIRQQQQNVLEETAKSSNDQQKMNELANRQEGLSAKQKQLEQTTNDLQKRMEEFFTEMPAEKLEKLNELMKQMKLQQQMKQAAQQMRNGQSQEAQQLQQQAEQQAEENSQQIDQLQQEMLQNQAQYIMNAMRQAINNLLELSKREEVLKQQSQSAPPNSQQLRQNAEEQMSTLQDMGHVLAGLGELAQRSFAITPEMGRSLGEALAKMQSALRALESRNGMQASQDQNGAMAALNKSATQVQQALQQMMQGGNGSGGGMGSLLQQLGMMAGQQMGINMGTQQLGNGQLSMEQAAQAARLAQQQEAVRKSLDQLNKEAQESGQRDRILGDLSQIAEEMKEVIRNLEQQNVNPETVKKQERILSRLLDASKSMRERDFEKKRKAQTGTQITRRSPGELDPSVLEGNSKLRDDLLKALEQGYSKDYQELIRKYFDQLQKIKGQ